MIRPIGPPSKNPFPPPGVRCPDSVPASRWSLGRRVAQMAPSVLEVDLRLDGLQGSTWDFFLFLDD